LVSKAQFANPHSYLGDFDEFQRRWIFMGEQLIIKENYANFHY
jgi:hypothetical protein